MSSQVIGLTLYSVYIYPVRCPLYVPPMYSVYIIYPVHGTPAP